MERQCNQPTQDTSSGMIKINYLNMLYNMHDVISVHRMKMSLLARTMKKTST